MADPRGDPRSRIDPAINTPGREGLTGTAPANLYAPSFDREQVTSHPTLRRSTLSPRGGRISPSIGLRTCTSNVATS
jgi:hypothetical protein